MAKKDPYADLPPDVAKVMRDMDKRGTLKQAQAAMGKGTVRGSNIQSGGPKAAAAAAEEAARKKMQARSDARLAETQKKGLAGRRKMIDRI